MTEDKYKRPHLAEANKATRFKKGKSGNADSSINPYSIRNSIRWAMAQRIDMEDIEGSIKELLKDEKKRKKKDQRPMIHRAIALTAVKRTLEKGEARHLEIIIEQVDGKLVQPIELSPDKVSEEEFTDLESAAAAWAADIKL